MKTTKREGRNEIAAASKMKANECFYELPLNLAFRRNQENEKKRREN